MIKKTVVVLSLILLVSLVAACSSQPSATPVASTPTMESDGNMDGGMDMSSMGDAPVVPAGMAYAEGEEIRFIHTEVSDSDIAELLTAMMDSPVLWVPGLANVPESALSLVYVFTNGVVGMGPLGFQPDVFDNPPGTPGYSPLRKIVLATWAEGVEARELKSLTEVIGAESSGELTLETSDIIVNMPFITWPGGNR